MHQYHKSSFTEVTNQSQSGLTLDSTTGLIDGDTDVAGDFFFTVEVTDSAGNKDLHEYEIEIDNANGTFDIDPYELDAALVGQPYSQTFSGYEGVAPFTFTVRAGFNLPSGLGFNGDTLSGTPTQAGQYLVIIEAKDATGELTVRGYILYIV